MKINIDLLTDHASKLRGFILDLIFPIECLGCGQEGIWLCEKCFRQLKFKPAQYCLHCKKENKFGQFCLVCQQRYALDGVWIAGIYEEQVIAKLIKSLKYGFAQDLATELGRFLILFLRDLINKSRIRTRNSRISYSDLVSGVDWRKFEQIAKRDSPVSLSQDGRISPANILLDFSKNLIMPVPLHSKRRRWRGFNQAEIIAKEVADHFKLDFNSDKLVRTKHKKPQAKLGERDRKSNIIDCFYWNGSELANRNVILIDDVVTTGSTLNECARILKDNGAGEVWGLVVAKG